MTKQVLIAFASKHRGTEDIAHWIADDLRARGIVVSVRKVDDEVNVSDYDAVVLGSAVYMRRWMRSARRFAHRYRHELSRRPVWLFSSGPLDHAVRHLDVRPGRDVARIALEIDARGHMTFGGILTRRTPGRLASALAKTSAGDYRNRDDIRRWANAIATVVINGSGSGSADR
jgi:menaquinone-dependent protoporphyrinogen oxidase